jgi:hypothetical protein
MLLIHFDADDWLKTVGKMLTTAQCDDREKVLFAVGQLQGSAGAWWDAYTMLTVNNCIKVRL